MAAKSGRKYSRDKNGRFASGGGGGGSAKTSGSKSASSRSTNTARAKDLKAKGTTAIGSRVKAKGFAGGKSAQKNAGGLRSSNTATMKNPMAGSFKAQKAGAAAAKASKQRAASKAGMKPGSQMKKAAPNAAKSEYKKLKTEAKRTGRANMYSTNKADATAAGVAKRKLGNFVKKRGVTKKRKK
jgi:hypothetical protein